jgi:hypothetical protein
MNCFGSSAPANRLCLCNSGLWILTKEGAGSIRRRKGLPFAGLELLGSIDFSKEPRQVGV